MGIEWKVPASKNLYIESAGKKGCCMGYLGQGMEFWIYPIKVIRNFRKSYFLPELHERGNLDDFSKEITLKPEKTEILYSHPLFTMLETFFTPVDAAVSFVKYDIDTSTPINIVFSFEPELNLMWPGSIGGQYCYWDETVSGYVMSEPTNSFSAIIRTADARRYSKEGDHAFSSEPYSMFIELPKGYHSRVVTISAFNGARDKCKTTAKVFEESFSELEMISKHYYMHYLENTAKITTPDPELNRFFEWGKISLVKGMVDNPYLGEGLVAGIGPSLASTRPGFNWFFAGDTSINSLALTSYGDLENVKKSLEFSAKYQNEDGRIPHEISQSATLVDWFNKYSGFAYLHADTTAYFLLALCDFVTETGDLEFARKMNDVIRKAFEFCIKVSDEDGLILNEKAGLGALEIGEFRKPKYDIYTNGIWAAALNRLIHVMEAIGEIDIANKAKEILVKLLPSLEKFWSDYSKRYNLSIDKNGNLLEFTVPWAFIPISFDLLDKSRSHEYLKTLKHSGSVTPWGVRSIEPCEHYDPINYNFGSVWYFFNGFVSLSAYKLNDPIFGHSIIKAASKALCLEKSGHVPELYSGDRFAKVLTAVPHQLFSIGPIIMAIIRGLFGIEKDQINKTLKLSPRIPPSWEKCSVKNIRFGKNTLSVDYIRKGKEIVLKIYGEIAEEFNLSLDLEKPYLGDLIPMDGKPWMKSERRSTLNMRVSSNESFSLLNTGIYLEQKNSDLGIGHYEMSPIITSILEKDNTLLEINVLGNSCEELGLRVFGKPITTTKGITLREDDMTNVIVPLSKKELIEKVYLRIKE